jgi:glycosyltransferase involved in cell wall biosynthesis
MRVVLIHRYFWPDTPPYAHILKEIALRLADAGHEVHVLTCQPSYRPSEATLAPGREELGDRITVRRWPVLPDRGSAAAKVLNLVLFCARLAIECFRLCRVDVVMAASTPPVAVASVAAWLARRRGARFVYHKQDIYPEAVVAAGMVRARWLSGLLRWIDARTDRLAHRVVVLSRDMAETVLARGVAPERIAVINNFDPWDVDDASVADGSPAAAVADAAGHADHPLRVAFVGAFGRFQNVETVVAALARIGNDPRIEVHFFGEGSRRGFVERAAADRGLANVRVHGYRPPHDVAEFLRTADLGVVSLPPGLTRAAYPSRTMTYLRQGCPVLALVDGDSELARTIVAAGAGFQVDPTSAERLADTLRDLADRPDELLGGRKCAADLYREQFSAERQLARWMDLFHRIGEEGTP